MIGVISKQNESEAVREFFELFKTPWEFHVPNRNYDFLIITTEEVPDDLTASVVAIYNSNATTADANMGFAAKSKQDGESVYWDGVEFPVYGSVSHFHAAGRTLVQGADKSEIVGLASETATPKIARIGYDLFHEVALLLSKGQPAENAHIPTLEIHISLLRRLMLHGGVPFVEIPPVPAGYDFMACLTHDVDFTGIREHTFDHTMWGFLYRASVGSLFDALRGRTTWSKCMRNWGAVLSLPLVLLGLEEDYWLEFDRYMEIEKDLGSTFFFIPYKDRPGTLGAASAPKHRASKYDVMENKDVLRKLIANGCEVGLHGLDAWQDSAKARTEKERIADAAGQSVVGTRMHWLYFGEGSAKAFEEAGLIYDSTFGYNDAVGFRGGTAQAFCPLGTDTFIELPLVIQDTALFYPGRMHLSEKDALDSCQKLIEFATIFGGALTINWHTRSLSPERLWDEFYASLLKQMQANRVWFGTAEQVVTWFRKRRAIQFDQVEFIEGNLRLKITDPSPDDRNSFLIRIHDPRMVTSTASACADSTPMYSDIPLESETALQLAP